MILNKKTRELWAEKIVDLSNIGAGALIFGQFLSEKGFSLSSIFLGVIIILIGYTISFALLKKK